jgi:hypothetical protein
MLATLVLGAFAGALQGPKAEGELVPVLHHGRKTAVEWVAELEARHGAAPEIVWALYHAGARTPAVLGALERWVDVSTDPATRRAIDTVLLAWGAALPRLGAADYAAPGPHVPADAVFPLPPHPSDADEADLARDLASTDPMRVAGAAVALLRRRVRVDDALLALHRVVPDLRPKFDARPHPTPPTFGAAAEVRFWCEDHAGTAHAHALAGALARADSDEARMRIVRALEVARGDVSPAAHALEALAEGKGELAQLAREAWNGAVGWNPLGNRDDEDRDWSLHAFHLRRSPRNDRSPSAQESLDRVFGGRLERAIERGELTRELLVDVHAVALGSDPLAKRCERLLDPVLDRDDEVGLEALRLLCHLRLATPHARQRYLERMRAWDRFDAAGLELVPCWPAHDAETLEAFARVVRKAKDAHDLYQRFLFAGLKDTAREPLVQVLLDGSARGALHWAIRDGFRGIVAVDETALPEVQINAIALNIATRRERGEDTARDEEAFARVLGRPYDRDGAGGYSDYVQWGFFHARSLQLRSPEVVELALRYAGNTGTSDWDFSTHTDAAIAYLDTAVLGLEDEVRVARMLPYHPPGPRWRGIDIVQPVDGGITTRKTAIELVPAMRCALYAGNVRALADLLRVTRISERDEDYLLAVLDRGEAGARHWALGLVEEHALASERLAAAVRHACADLDDAVASAATKLRAARGW